VTAMFLPRSTLAEASAARKGGARDYKQLGASKASPPWGATLSNCGKLLSSLHYRGSPKGRVQHQGNDLEDGKNVKNRDDPQPSPKSPRGYGCSSQAKW
jgi:hypothetical protein